MADDNQDLKSKNFIEAVKLLNDWNKWFIAIETAVIGIIGALFKLDGVNVPDKPIGYLIVAFSIITIVCFVTSIILSMTLMMSFSFFAEGRQRTKDGRMMPLMDHEGTHGEGKELPDWFYTRFIQKDWIQEKKGRGLPVWFYTKYLHRLFLIGMITFALSIILLPFARK